MGPERVRIISLWPYLTLDNNALWVIKINGLVQVTEMGTTMGKMVQTALKHESLDRLVEALHTTLRIFGKLHYSLPF